jgi:hypothetical protein
VDLLLVGHFLLLFTDLGTLSMAAAPLLRGADPPLRGSTGSPNGRGGGVDREPTVVLTSSWLRAIGP